MAWCCSRRKSIAPECGNFGAWLNPPLRESNRSTMAAVMLLEHGARSQAPCAPSNSLRLRHGACQAAGSALHLVAPRAVGRGHVLEHATETRPAHGVLRGKVRAAVKRPSVGQQEAGERPAALSGNGADRRLVARIHVRTLVAVYFHRDEQAIDQLGQLRVFVALAVNHVAPVAPHRADVQQDGLVFGAGTSERFLAPLKPLHRLVCRRTQSRGSRNSPDDSGFARSRNSSRVPLRDYRRFH